MGDGVDKHAIGTEQASIGRDKVGLLSYILVEQMIFQPGVDTDGPQPDLAFQLVGKIFPEGQGNTIIRPAPIER